MTLDDAFMIFGYLMVIGGLALYSVAAALIIGGVVLFISAGLAVREGGKR